ncbi:MAG: D-aminoacylase [Candidatus Bathyarchaeota archaeon]
MTFDILIKKGKIIDGTGNTWYKSDIAVEDGKIAAIGSNLGRADKVIDAKGHIVAPGFIDIHSHSDIPLLIDPRGMSKITQGVTTEVIGNCGLSAAPMNQWLQEYRNRYARAQLSEGFSYNWTDMSSYLEKLEEKGIALNGAPLAGHGTIRQCVMGDVDQLPTFSMLNEMKKLLRDSLDQGAWGLSTGLIYTPNQYSSTEEIIELAKELPAYDALYATHIRGEGNTVIQAIDEANRIGREAGVRVQISHFKVCGSNNWGKSKDTLQMVIDARANGVDVDFDQYPYAASSTGLSAILPPWVHSGGIEQLIERLKDPETRAKIRSQPTEEMEDWNRIQVVHARNHPDYIGLSIDQIASQTQTDPFDAMCDLLIAEDSQVLIVLYEMEERDVRRIMSSQLGMVGSDGRAIASDSVFNEGKCHPRYYGTFPRVLGYYVREGVQPLQEAVRKMTSAPARRLGIRDRGLLLEGMKADITIFSPEKVKDNATFTDPHRYSSGIPYVLVNGEPVVSKSKYTGALPGMVLRKSHS